MGKGADERSYKHDSAKLNREIERVDKRVKAVFTEAQKQRSVVKRDRVDNKIPEGIFHIDRDGEIWIRTKLGLKQLKFV